MLKTLLDPVSSVPRAVEGRRWGLPMLALCAAVTFSGVAFAYRLDPTAAVIRKLEMTGELAKSSERELGEEVQQAHRIALVGGAAKGIFVMPLVLLLVSVALKVAAWLAGKKLVFAEAFTVAAVAFLPIALFHVIYGVVALKQGVVTASMAQDLLPSSLSVLVGPEAAKLGRVLRQVDFFNVWAVVLLGLGFAQGTKLKPSRGLALCLLLYVMLSAVLVGLPGLAPPPGQGAPPS
ncbi:MAG: YIP1 family protein [Myxococcaceae bacterium]|nr:YIP1 family protein [Myxococcaceae bacterium]